MLRASRQKGFGIPELLIGIAVGMVIVAAAMQLLQSTLAGSKDNIKMARVEQELRQTMQMISRDLRRATTWDAATAVTRVGMLVPLTLSGNSGSVTVGTTESDDAGIDHLADIGDKAVGGKLVYIHTDVDDIDGDGDKSETFTFTGNITAYNAGSYTVTLNQTDGHDWPASVTSTDGVPEGTWSILRPETTITYQADPACLLFFYDYDSDEDGDLTDSGGAYEMARFGYRRDGTNGAVEIRVSSSATCGSTTGWEDLTDPEFVNVTQFDITENLETVPTSSGLSVDVRVYTITLTGRHVDDASVVRTLRETIRVRNDSLS